MLTLLASLALLVQDVALPSEIPAAYAALVGVLTSAIFGVVKYLSAKVNSFSAPVKMVLALVAGFVWKYAIAAAAGIGIPLPDTVAGLGDVGLLTVTVGGVLAMGIRAAFKALLPKVSAAVKA